MHAVLRSLAIAHMKVKMKMKMKRTMMLLLLNDDGDDGDDDDGGGGGAADDDDEMMMPLLLLLLLGLTGVCKIQWEEEVLDQSCPDQFFKTWVDEYPIWMILNISIYRDLVIFAGLHQLLRTSTTHTCSGKVGGPRQVLREQGLGLL